MVTVVQQRTTLTVATQDKRRGTGGVMEREEPSCTGWADVSVSALRHDLPRDVLLLNLQKVQARLAAQVAPLTRDEDHVVLDEVLRALVEPRMLHHRSRRLQGLVLACLREALRVYRLDESQGIHTSGDQKAPKAAKEPARPSVANPPAVEQVLAAPPPLGGEILLTASGELCQLIRDKDWSSTPWGPLSEWPQALKIALAVCLFSRFPLVIYWGPDYRMLYNDAYRPIMGTKHPEFLARNS